MKPRDRQRFEDSSIPEPNSGCFLWIGRLSYDGYGKFRANGKTLRAHRVAWELYRGVIPPGLLVCHKCDVPSCVNPNHLWLGTDLDNSRDMMTKGRWRPPAHMPQGKKLSVAALIEIRLLAQSGDSQTNIARRYGVCQSMISRVLNNTRRRHVENV